MKRTLIVCAALLLARPALGHHSFAIYDFDTEIPFEGVVETLTFRNPHISMTLRVEDESGEEKIVNFAEGAPANMLAREGLEPAMIAPGTRIRAVGSPLIEDPEQYFLRTIVLEDGREF